MSLYLPDIEQHLLGLLLNSPQVYPDVSFLTREDFADVRQHLYDVLRLRLEANEAVTPVIIAEKLKGYGQMGAEIAGVDTLTYLDGLQRRGKSIKSEDAGALAKELKKASIKRELIAKCKEAQSKIEAAKTLDEMTTVVTKTISSVETAYYKGGETSDFFGTMEANIEESGAKEKEELGYVGVIPSIDRTLGPLLYRGAFSLVGSRSGGGKSSFGFDYVVETAEKHGFPILWLDAGEMTEAQLQYRAACCFARGKIPLWAARSNGWRRNKEYTEIMRDEVFPRVRKLKGKFHFRSVVGMSREEKIAFMRRFHHNKVGKDNFLAIVDDYLKGIESMGKETKEYQTIGYYTSDVKNLVTNDINAGFWTSVQLNRFGVSKGKKADEIVDNDSTISLSDRIKDNCTSVLIMRYKVMEELAREKNQFGNVLVKVAKIREGLGRDYEMFAQPVKLAKGFAENYFNLDYHGFHYRDCGLFSDIATKLGQTAVDLSQREGDEKMP